MVKSAHQDYIEVANSLLGVLGRDICILESILLLHQTGKHLTARYLSTITRIGKNSFDASYELIG